MKKNVGITLIALIITVIVIIILTGVTVDLVIDKGLFDSVEKAESKTNKKVQKQQSRVDNIKNEMDEIDKIVDKGEPMILQPETKATDTTE